MERCVVDGTIIRHVVDDAIDRLIRPSNCVKTRYKYPEQHAESLTEGIFRQLRAMLFRAQA